MHNEGFFLHYHHPPTSHSFRLAVLISSRRYTGITECDIKLRISPVVDDAAPIGLNDSPPANAFSISFVLKNTLTFQQLFTNAQESLLASIAASGSKLDINAKTFNLEFHQTISAELASSGFQHLVHIYIQSSGKGANRTMNARYEFPPMLTPGQADPRLRVNEHLPGIIDGMIKIATRGDLASSPIHELQFLPPSERDNLIKVWSGLPQYGLVDRSDQLLHELFEATAARFPDRPAIECAAPYFRTMTYAQMSRRTNQLARWMRNNGVGVGSYVGMWLPRGMEMYIALIAILKAGAAYVS